MIVEVVHFGMLIPSMVVDHHKLQSNRPQPVKTMVMPPSVQHLMELLWLVAMLFLLDNTVFFFPSSRVSTIILFILTFYFSKPISFNLVDMNVSQI